MKKYLLFILLTLLSGVIYAQDDLKSLKDYNDYVRNLDSYKASLKLTADVSDAFMEGNIKEVRRLSGERERLLMETIEKLMVFKPDARKSMTASQVVSKLSFNLGFQNNEKVLKMFEPEFDSPYLQEMRSELEKEAKVQPGQPASDFQLFDKEGKEYTMDDFKGKYIFLEFSASWCSWCKKELPAIREAYDQFKDQVVFITVHLDDSRDKWLKDIEAHQVPWHCLSDLKAWKSPLAGAYNISGVPNCFIISPDRLIKAKGIRGPEISEHLVRLLSGAESSNVGIRFEQSTLEGALSQAKKSGKPIFMDCYTSWCAPCKMMNTTVFTDSVVGDFFNNNFINIKFDMEKGEGKELAKRYPLQVYPTYLILDNDGNEIHRVVGGHDARTFIEKMKAGMDPENSIAGMQKHFKQGKCDTAFLRAYIENLGGGYCYGDIPPVINELCRQIGTDISVQDWKLINRYMSDPDSYAFEFVVKNRKKLGKRLNPEDIERKIYTTLYPLVFNAVNDAVYDEQKYNAEHFTMLRKKIRFAAPPRADYLSAMLHYYTAYRNGKIAKVLDIYEKNFILLPGEDRFGPTLQLNSMLIAKGSKEECRKGLELIRKISNAADPLFQNMEKALTEKIQK